MESAEPVSVAVGIVAHIDRQAEADQLAVTARADIINVDDSTLGCERNHRRVWELLSSTAATHAVVLEDDAIPVPDFRHQLEMAVKASPAPVTSLYLGRQRPPQWQHNISRAIGEAKAHGAHYILGHYLLHGVGVAIRTDLITPMLRFVDRYDYLPIDEAIGKWCRDSGLGPIAYTAPSILDHADGMSLISHRDGQGRAPGRTAWTVGSRTLWDGERTVNL